MFRKHAHRTLGCQRVGKMPAFKGKDAAGKRNHFKGAPAPVLSPSK
jgi:hypothetical protein